MWSALISNLRSLSQRGGKRKMKPFEINFSCKVYKILPGLSSLYKTLFFVAFYQLDLTHFTLLVLYWCTFCSFLYIFPELFVFVECCPIAQPPRVWHMKLLSLHAYLSAPTYCLVLAAGGNSIPSWRLSLPIISQTYKSSAVLARCRPITKSTVVTHLTPALNLDF